MLTRGGHGGPSWRESTQRDSSLSKGILARSFLGQVRAGTRGLASRKTH